MKLRSGCVVAGFLSLVFSVAAQTVVSGPITAQVPPPLIQFSNVATDEGGNSLSGVVSITFSFYSGQQGGQPLWTETQNNIQLDTTGHYSVQLGITKPAGVPTASFTTGEARWLGVRIAEQAEQPRILLLSVPYALKAGDAETIGGLPPSAFVLAAPLASAGPTPLSATASATAQISPPPLSGAITGTGNVNYLPLWDTTSDIISSVLFQSGTGTTAKIGINTNTPASTLDVKGGSTVRGILSLPATGVATATKASNSQPLNLAASAFNSSTSAAANQTFQWQAEPVGNDTSAPSGTLNLLFGEGTTKPSETGLLVASNGQIKFATGQTFPETGAGTVTSVASGAGLTGGPITGSGTLSIANAGVTNAMLANPSLSVTAGTALTGGGAVALGGSTTLNLDTTKIPQLNATNIFTGNQTVNGNLSATGMVTGSSFQIGSNLFDYGSYAAENAFLGFAGNSTITGQFNTAVGPLAFINNTSGRNNTVVGVAALNANTTGSYNTGIGTGALSTNSSGNTNTAVGDNALTSNTTGGSNTANGWAALFYNTTGAANTAMGYLAGTDASTPSLNNATAIGAYADVTVSNALVLGGIAGTNGCTTQNNCASINVGIGTTAPASTLDVHGTGNFTGAVNFGAPVTFLTSQTFPNTITAVNAGTDVTASSSGGTVTLNVDTTKVPQLSGTNMFTETQTINATTGNGLLGTTTDSTGSGVFGINYAASGVANGISGSSFSSTGTGVFGFGLATGVSGTSNTTTGTGVLGFSTSLSGAGIGVFGKTATSAGYGVEGLNSATTGSAIGAYGQSASTTGFAVVGVNIAASGSGVGVYGQTTASMGYGVEGFNYATTGNAYGVYGASESSSGSGVYGNSNGGTGVTGLTSVATGTGVVGINTAGGNAGLFQGNVGVTGNLNIGLSNSYQIGGSPFAFGSSANDNAFVGFAGNMNTSNTGTADTAIGFNALVANTTGYDDIAGGHRALFDNTTGFNDTAIGSFTLSTNSTGNNNTAIGFSAGQTGDFSDVTASNDTAVGASAAFSTGSLTNATVIGSYAEVAASNALVLGSINGVNHATASVNVGIGTTTPTHALEVNSAGASSAQIVMLSTGSDAAISLNNRGTGGREYWIDSGSGSAGVGNGNFAVWDNDAGATRLVITSGGNVGIGTTSPDNMLSVNGSADKTGGGSWGTFSDGRLKTVNGGFTDGLRQIMKIQPVHYRYKPGNTMGIRDTDEHIGVVAQDVQKVIPEAVTENSKGYLLVNNDPIIWTMLNAIKEQQGEVQREQAGLAKALRQIKQQQGLIKAQSAAMGSLQAEVRETRETLRKVKAKMAAAQPALVAGK